MIAIIKEQLNFNFDIRKLANYSEILLLDDGIYNLNFLDFSSLNIRVNLLKDDLKARGNIKISNEKEDYIILNYKSFVNLMIKNKCIFLKF